MAEKTYKMTAKKSFVNARIKGPRDGGSVLPGESFETDFLHAQQLVVGGLAEPAAGVDLSKEPTDPIDASHGLSVTEHKPINERRAKAAGAKGGATGATGDATGASGATGAKVA